MDYETINTLMEINEQVEKEQKRQLNNMKSKQKRFKN